MTIKRIMLVVAFALVGCEGAAPVASPFHPEDKVVPVALDPDRPRPPAPSTGGGASAFRARRRKSSAPPRAGTR